MVGFSISILSAYHQFFGPFQNIPYSLEGAKSADLPNVSPPDWRKMSCRQIETELQLRNDG